MTCLFLFLSFFLVIVFICSLFYLSCVSLSSNLSLCLFSYESIFQVKWHPTSEYIFGSVDYAGVVRVWDLRAPKAPLGSAASHSGKGLCIDWLAVREGEEGEGEGVVVKVVSGGSDCAVKATAFN